MPYLLLLIGLVLALTAFYRFFLKADARQIKAMFLSVGACGVGLAALFLAVTGRFPMAIAILAALWPIVIGMKHNKTAHTDLPMTPSQAYEVLGLPHGAPPEDIKEAHIRLMKKVHPDAKGSDWLAKQINAAKDLLLKNP